jgi:acyl transferase domain-containing protein
MEEYEPEHKKAYRMHNTFKSIIVDAKTDKILVKELKKICEMTFYQIWKRYEIRKLEKSNPRVGFVVYDLDQVKKIVKEIITSIESGKKMPKNVFYSKCSQGINDKVVALFSGQGSQYTNMFSDVAMNWPQFRDSIDMMNKSSSKICEKLVSDVLYPREPYTTEKQIDESIIGNVMNTQITTASCSIGTYDIFRDAGLKPTFFGGHSMGEYVALYASDHIEKEQICDLVCNRAKIMYELAPRGGVMYAIIGKGASQIKLKNSSVSFANINSGSQVIISGDKENVEKEVESLKSYGFKTIKLNVSAAYHTKHMSKSEQELGKHINKLNWKSPKTKLFSNLTGKQYPKTAKNCKNNLTKHMSSKVQFMQMIQNMYNDGGRVFVEFGPKSTLGNLVKSILPHADVTVCSVNSSTTDDSDKQLRLLATQLSVVGVELENFDPWQVENPFENKKTKIKANSFIVCSYVH